MPKIVVPLHLDFYPDQIERLKKLGDVTFYKERSKTPDEWYERVRGADIICGGKFGLKERYQDLENVFISLPFVGVGFFDKEVLKKNNITVANSPGCNKVAVSEWIIGMIFNLIRRFPFYINNSTLEAGAVPSLEKGLKGKDIVILGKGHIGSRVGKICEALEMNVIYFKRGDDLMYTVQNADVIVDTLTSNPTTEGLLDEDFFMSLKKGAYFLTVTGSSIYDVDAMIQALNNDILAGVAIDAGNIKVGDINDPLYRKLSKHSKILVTPHIAWATDESSITGNDMMIDNIEAWLAGNPINVII